jgi:hypothetical protein
MTFLLFGLLMTGAAALFPVMLFSTTEAKFRLAAADCAAPDVSLAIATAWCFPAAILAVVSGCNWLGPYNSTKLGRFT